MRVHTKQRWVRGLGIVVVTALLLSGGKAFAEETGKQKNASAKTPKTDQYGDPLPVGAVAALGSQRLRPIGDVISMAWSPDGKMLATGIMHSTAFSTASVTLWDTATGRAIVKRLQAAKATQITHLRFSSNSQSIIGSGVYGTAEWDTKSGKRTSFQVVSGSLAPGGETSILFGRGRNELKIRDTATGMELATIRIDGNQNGFQAYAFSPNRKTLATGTFDGQLHLWEARTGKLRFKLRIPRKRIVKVAFTPDGKTLVAAGGHRGIHLFDTSTGKPIRVITPAGIRHTRPRDTFTISSDGKWIAVASRESSTVSVHAVSDGEQMTSIPTGIRAIKLLEFSPDGSKIAVAKEQGSRRDHRLEIWSVANAKRLLVTQGHSREIHRITFSPDGDLIATAGYRSVRLWKARTGRQIVKWTSHSNDRVAFSPNGTKLGTASLMGLYRIWEVATGNEHVSGFVGRDAISSGRAVAFSPELNLLAIGMDRGQVVMFDTATGKKTRTIGVRSRGKLSAVAISPNGKFLATTIGSTRGRENAAPMIAIYDLKTGKKLQSLISTRKDGRIDEPGYNTLMYSPDGQTLFAAGYGVGVSLWDARGVGGPHKISVDASSPFTFSQDGKSLIALKGGRSANARSRFRHLTDAIVIQFIEVTTGNTYLELREKKHPITAIALSPRGDLLATAFSDVNNVVVWNVRPPSVKIANEKSLQQAWDALSGQNAEAAHKAKWTLIAAGDRSLKRIQSGFKSIGNSVDEKRVRELIGKLGDRKFPIRQEATDELKAIGAKAVPELRAALAANPEPEVKRRLQALLQLLTSALQKLSGEPLRRIRAIQVLERIDSDAAKKLLEQIAKGPSGARETIDAKAALQRIDNLRRGR